MKYALIIMIKDEIEGIVQLFDQIPFDKFDEVVAIDGMSVDGSAEFLKKKNVKVITQTVNGRGQAFRDAFRGTNSDALIFYGPDGNEDPTDIVKFMQVFENNKNAGMVVARRLGPGAINKEDYKFTFEVGMAYFLFFLNYYYLVYVINRYAHQTYQYTVSIIPDSAVW